MNLQSEIHYFIASAWLKYAFALEASVVFEYIPVIDEKWAAALEAFPNFIAEVPAYNDNRGVVHSLSCILAALS